MLTAITTSPPSLTSLEPPEERGYLVLHRIDAIHPLCKMAFNPSGCIQRVGCVAGNDVRARDGLLRE
jgi:hypothetical protein